MKITRDDCPPLSKDDHAALVVKLETLAANQGVSLGDLLNHVNVSYRDHVQTGQVIWSVPPRISSRIAVGFRLGTRDVSDEIMAYARRRLKTAGPPS